MIRALSALLAVGALLASAPAAPGTGRAKERGTYTHHEIQVRYDPRSGRFKLCDEVILPRGRSDEFALAPWLDATVARPTGRRPRADGGPLPLNIKATGVVPTSNAPAGRGGWTGAALRMDGSAALPAWSGWLPDFGGDRVTWRLTVQLPAGFRAVASGRLESAGDAADGHRAVFVADRPGEPPSLFVGRFRVGESQAGAVRLRTWFHPSLTSLSADYLAAAGGYITRYAERIGPYPYADFHLVSSPWPVGLGFPALAYVGRRVLPLPFMRGRSLAHEVLHNWWGNGVAVAPGSGNWVEGLTTYMADYALAADRGSDAAREMRLGWLRDYAALPATRDRPLRDFTARRHQAAQVIGYGKSAYVFHMLRGEVGDAAFDDGLRRFWRRHSFDAAGWADLRAAFEQTAGRQLDWFFTQWLARPGAPALELGPTRVSAASGGYRLDLVLRQAAPTFRLTVPLRVETAAGPLDTRIALAGPEAAVRLGLDAAPVSVHVDPELALFRRLAPGEGPPILRDVTLSDAAVLLLPDSDPQLRDAAVRLARRLLDTPTPPLAGTEQPRGPALVIGSRGAVAALLAGAGWQLDRAPPDGPGTAVVWTARRADGQPVLLVAADDAAALQAVVRPLPHYGGKSYLRFTGQRAAAKGVWPPGDSPLSRRLGQP